MEKLESPLRDRENDWTARRAPLQQDLFSHRHEKSQAWCCESSLIAAKIANSASRIFSHYREKLLPSSDNSAVSTTMTSHPLSDLQPHQSSAPPPSMIMALIWGWYFKLGFVHNLGRFEICN
ncbi:hypothetical protein TIFTF001_030501 [Ficus carica]|uniref:Uncharacterized protein n=1 Tax=Ficus carica TaxID=3494 RepID=A0AA88J515_FICCA|nr:hypothetical protein TIFTF001_030501 [Ficus carica]